MDSLGFVMNRNIYIFRAGFDDIIIISESFIIDQHFYRSSSTHVSNVRVVSALSYQDQSGEQSEDFETEEQLQVRILAAAMEFVPEFGWTVEAIAAGAEVSRFQYVRMGSLRRFAA